MNCHFIFRSDQEEIILLGEGNIREGSIRFMTVKDSFRISGQQLKAG